MADCYFRLAIDQCSCGTPDPDQPIAFSSNKKKLFPADVGGVPGYYEFLDVIANPDHEEYEEMLEWCGGSFNPKFFDIDATNANLKRIRL